MKSMRVDLTGQSFDRLTVLSYAGNDQDRRALWRCACSCGKDVVVLGKWLRAGRVKSCGCLRKEMIASVKASHRMSATATYRSWASMLTRCSNPKQESYKRYGEIGICVCEQWKRFENFFDDMGVRPEGRTLDRINPFGNYEPGNCRWATPSEQSRNTRGHVAIQILEDGYKSFSPAGAFESGYTRV